MTSGIIVIATHNSKKAGEMTRILSRRFPSIEFLTLADFPGAPEPEETGSTYAENAVIKAVSAAEFTGELSLADDAGLEIDAMNGEPGLYSRRFAGEDTPFPQKMAAILDRLGAMEGERRNARFRCCVAAAWHRSKGEIATTTFEATCAGRISFEPFGDGGFGYDPIFFLPQLDRTMAELTQDEKDAVSHRGKVLDQVAEWLAGQPATALTNR